MIKGTENRNQEAVRNWLEGYDIYPFSVTFTLEFDGLLCITFFIRQDLDELLNILEYKRKCDKSGYRVIKETNTIIISGLAIGDLLRKME